MTLVPCSKSYIYRSRLLKLPSNHSPQHQFCFFPLLLTCSFMFIEICQIVHRFRKQLQPWVTSMSFSSTHTQMHWYMLIRAQTHTPHLLAHGWVCLALTKRCYTVSNQYLSPFTASYLSIFSSRTEKEGKRRKTSEKVIENETGWVVWEKKP